MRNIDGQNQRRNSNFKFSSKLEWNRTNQALCVCVLQREESINKRINKWREREIPREDRERRAEGWFGRDAAANGSVSS